MKLCTLILATLMLPIASFAQERYGETEDQQLLCKEAISVYRSYKKQKNYDEALIQWKKACDVCPLTATENILRDGVTFLNNQLKKTEDEARRASITDSIFSLYDQRMELFPATKKYPKNNCMVLAQKGMDQYKIFKKAGAAEAAAMLKESIECLGSDTTITRAIPAALWSKALSSYYVTSFYAMKAIEDDAIARERLGEMLTEYLMLTSFIEDGVAVAEATAKPKDVEKYEKAKSNIDKVFIAIANCEDMVPVLSEKVYADTANFELKKKVLRLLNQKDCTDNELYLPVGEAVHAKEPSHPSAFAIGGEQAKVENFSEALRYMEQAVELCGDCTEMEMYLLKAGKVASFLGKTSTARNYAQQVLAINGESADALMLIGDAIAGAASKCDDGALGKRLAYLRACDYYQRAVNKGDEETAAKARKKLNSNSKQFPSVEEIFTVGKSVGNEITIPPIAGCPCSGEKTAIRVR